MPKIMPIDSYSMGHKEASKQTSVHQRVLSDDLRTEGSDNLVTQSADDDEHGQQTHNDLPQAYGAQSNTTYQQASNSTFNNLHINFDQTKHAKHNSQVLLFGDCQESNTTQ